MNGSTIILDIYHITDLFLTWSTGWLQLIDVVQNKVLPFIIEV